MPTHFRSTKSVESYLVRFLNKMSFLLDSDLTFKPKHGSTTQKVMSLIIPKFNQTITEITPKLDKLSSEIIYRTPVKSKYGIYIDTVISNMNQISYNSNLSDTNLQNQIKNCLDHNRDEELYELYNRNHQLLYDYWRISNKPPSGISDLYSYFCSPEILVNIEKKILVSRKIYTSYASNNFHLTISGRTVSEVTGDLVDTLVIRLCCMLGLAKHISGETFHVSIWLSDDKKRLQYRINPNNRFLGIRNVNSGCTIRDEKTPIIGRVIIWRREECEKVLIHELIHASGLDFYQYPDSINDQVFQKYNISSYDTINLFEAYTETWTVIFSSTLYSIMNGSGSWEQVNELLRQETRFSFFQLAKIIDYFGYEKYSNCNFFCESGFGRNSNRKFNQGSSVLSYYIFKTALLYKLDDFLTYCISNNSKLEPWNYQDSITELWDTIQRSITCSKFINTAEDCLHKIRKYKETQTTNLDHQFGLITLRMTITG